MQKISIIITTKNSQQKIRACLEPILKQTYPMTEVLLLDGGSKDDTWNIALEYQKKVNHLVVHQIKQASKATLRNEGIKLATGEYVMFLEPEDILNIYAIEMLAKDLEDFDLILGGYKHPFYTVFFENKTYDFSNPKDFIAHEHQFFLSTKLTGALIRKSIAESISFKDIKLSALNYRFELSFHLNKVKTIYQLLLETKEYYSLFTTRRYWEKQESFWFYTKHYLTTYQHSYTKKQKSLDIPAKELVLSRMFDYIFWEFISYQARKTTVEALSMELYRILEDSTFKEYTTKYGSKGISFIPSSEDMKLANCILFANTIAYDIPEYVTSNPNCDIMNLFYLLFTKIFYRQVGMLNPTLYLDSFRDQLNLNEWEEAKFINGLDL